MMYPGASVHYVWVLSLSTAELWTRTSKETGSCKEIEYNLNTWHEERCLKEFPREWHEETVCTPFAIHRLKDCYNSNTLHGATMLQAISNGMAWRYDVCTVCDPPIKRLLTAERSLTFAAVVGIIMHHCFLRHLMLNDDDVVWAVIAWVPVQVANLRPFQDN